MNKIFIIFSILLSTLSASAIAYNDTKQFTLIPLGVKDSIDESNLTAYLLSPINANHFICLDAGTVWTGLKAGVRSGSFIGITTPKKSDLTLESIVLRQHIKAYLISHAHINRIAGLIVNSSIDIKKPILGLDHTIDAIKNHLFNWRIWPNLGDSGASPYLSRYHYVILPPKKQVHIANTEMYVKAFPLTQGKFFKSTAFLIQAGRQHVLYIGDIKSIKEENTPFFKELWKNVVPLVRKQQLHAIFMGISHPDSPSDKNMSARTPKRAMEALQQLAELVNATKSNTVLKGLTIIITNRQPSLLTTEIPVNEQIKTQLGLLNNLGVRFVFPIQGQRLEF